MNKERLRNIRYIYEEAEELKEKIIQFETMRTSPRSAVYGSERVQSSMKGDVQPDTLASLDALLRKYNVKLRACLKLIAEFEQALTVLNERERIILRKHYLDGMTWRQLQDEMNMCERNLKRINGRAVDKMIRFHAENARKPAK